MTPTDFRVNRDIRIVACATGPASVRFTVFVNDEEDSRVELSLAEAIQAGGDLVKNGSSEHFSPILFQGEDARAAGEFILRAAADE